MNYKDAYIRALKMKREFVENNMFQNANVMEMLMQGIDENGGCHDIHDGIDAISNDELIEYLKNGHGYITKMIYLIDDNGNPTLSDNKNEWIDDFSNDSGLPQWKFAEALFGSCTSDSRLSNLKKYDLSNAFYKVVYRTILDVCNKEGVEL